GTRADTAGWKSRWLRARGGSPTAQWQLRRSSAPADDTHCGSDRERCRSPDHYRKANRTDQLPRTAAPGRLGRHDHPSCHCYPDRSVHSSAAAFVLVVTVWWWRWLGRRFARWGLGRRWGIRWRWWIWRIRRRQLRWWRRERGAVAAAVEWWNKQKQPAPLFMTREELEHSADVFSMEFIDIKAQHRVLFGDDVITELQVPMHLHRTQVEYELREKLILLRQGLLLAAHDQRKTRHLLLHSVSAFSTLFRHALTATGGPMPASRRESVSAIA